MRVRLSLRGPTSKQIRMKKPPLNKYFRTTACWYSYSTDGDSRKHGPEEIIAIRYGKEEYNFIHTEQAYQHECLGDFTTWELITLGG